MAGPLKDKPWPEVVAALEARVEELEAALRWYTDPSNYNSDGAAVNEYGYTDQGTVAQNALATPEEE